MAAGVRHARALVLCVQHAGAVISVSVLPREQLLHCAVDLCELPVEALGRLRLLHVEPELDLVGRRGSPLQLPTRRLGPLAEWTTPQRPPVRRLLNALYLQSGLIVTRAFSTTQRSR